MFRQFTKILSQIKVLTAILACTLWTISAKADTVGNVFPIATTTGEESAISAAFDGTNYLLGILGDASSEGSITAQLVSQSGTLVGSRISVGRTGSGLHVAFDGTNYLMVWSDDDAYPGNDIYGQFISKTGTIVGTPFAINQADGYQDVQGMRSVVYDGTNYFVVFGSAPAPDQCNHEYGQFVTPSGQLLGSPIQINQTECGGGGNTLAFDGTKILAVWISEWTSGGTRNGCYNDSCESVNVVGQFITKSGAVTPGTLSGTNFWISESSVLKHIPSVSFNGTNYLVVFPEDTGLKDVCGENGCNKNISAYLITTGGSLASTKITVNNVAGQQIYPSVAFDGANHLVLWTDYRNDANNDQICDADEGTCADIYGQYVSTTGALLGSEFIINNDEGNQMGGFVGQAVNGRLFGLINTGVNMLQDSWGDVYGVFFDVSAISGRVYVNIAGHSDLGVRNAVVSLQGTQYSVSTDSNGNFNLANIPFGTYTLIVTAPNMNTITQIVSYTGQSLSIMLPPMTVFHCLKGDANDDAQLGLDDAVYILQTLAGLRPVGEIDVTGLWNVTVVSDKGGGTFTMDLTQSGNSVSGTTLIKGYSGTVSGSINGSDISLVVADPDPDCSGSVGTLTGTVSGNTMSGSHSSIAGGTCPAESGTWTATR